MASIYELEGKYTGQTCWVVGRGPSLGNLRKEHIEYPGPVLAINGAIREVEALGLDNKVYSMQKDHYYEEPKAAPLLVHKHESMFEDGAKIALYQPGFYVWDNELFGLEWHNPSVVSALMLSRLFGCVSTIYLACDSVFGDNGSFEHGGEITHLNADQYPHHAPIVRALSRRLGLQVDWRAL